MTTMEAPENKSQEQTNEWFIPDNILTSYLDAANNYSETVTENDLKWFNFDIPVPQETPKEAKEREQATMHQVQLGILRVVNQPQQQQRPQQTQPQNVQPPQPALAPDVAQSMGCIITPAFISKLNGEDVNYDSIPAEQPPQPIKPKQDDIVESIINNAAAKKEKYKFSLTGKQKIGKNDPCPCGSGQKFKRCHGR